MVKLHNLIKVFELLYINFRVVIIIMIIVIHEENNTLTRNSNQLTLFKVIRFAKFLN